MYNYLREKEAIARDAGLGRGPRVRMRPSMEPESPAEEEEDEGNSDDADDTEEVSMEDAATFRVFRDQINEKIGSLESDLGKFQKGMRVDVDKISEKLDLIVRAR